MMLTISSALTSGADATTSLGFCGLVLVITCAPKRGNQQEMDLEDQDAIEQYPSPMHDP